jgi:hypothetical protein
MALIDAGVYLEILVNVDFVGKDIFVSAVEIFIIVLLQSLKFVAVGVVCLANLTATVVVATDTLVDDEVREISANSIAKFSHVIVRHQELIVIEVHCFCCATNVKVSDLSSIQAKPTRLLQSSETHRCYQGRPVQAECLLLDHCGPT